MYNMNINIFGYNVDLQMLIFIGIIYLILVSHTFCGCCSVNGMGLIEGLATMATTDISGNNPLKDKKLAKAELLKTQVNAGGTSPLPLLNEEAKVKTAVGKKEGFTGANINYGQSSPYDLARNDAVDTKSWFQSNLSVIPGQSLNPAVKEFLARPEQPVPLPEGEMLMFSNTEFKPECCPNTYSTGSGCACMTGTQYNYLITRGSNNVPYSEY
jgi:hypothetical protein